VHLARRLCSRGRWLGLLRLRRGRPRRRAVPRGWPGSLRPRCDVPRWRVIRGLRRPSARVPRRAGTRSLSLPSPSLSPFHRGRMP
jgi:hypothetical protein